MIESQGGNRRKDSRVHMGDDAGIWTREKRLGVVGGKMLRCASEVTKQRGVSLGSEMGKRDANVGRKRENLVNGLKER